MSDDSHSSYIPSSIRAVYGTTHPNEPILLYEGEMDLQHTRGIIKATGRIQWVWQPQPSVHLECTHALPRVETPSAKVRLFGQSTFFDLSLYSMGMGLKGTTAYGTVKGHPIEMYWGSTTNDLSNIIFHIPNFLSFDDGRLREIMSEEPLPTMATTETKGWQIQIASSSDYGLSAQMELEDILANEITHVGRISRTDGSLFPVKEGQEILNVIYRWLSFCRGNWIAPILAVGHDSTGRRVWESWREWNIRASKRVRTWVNRQNTEFLEQTLSGLHSRALDPVWKDAIHRGIAWYIECNRRASGLEAALIVGQTGLELLGWTHLVENTRVISSGGFQELPAADKIRLLLASFGIPLEIPDELGGLKTLAKQRSWKDGPECLVALRNALVHPEAKNRKKVGALSSLNIYEVWNLGAWYLELALLHLLEYKGVYLNRLKRECTYEQALEKVPWVR